MRRLLFVPLGILLIVTTVACGPGKLFGPTFTPTPTVTSTPTYTSTPTSTPTYTPSPTYTPTPSPTPLGGGSGILVFGHYGNSLDHLDGSLDHFIFTANFDGSGLTQLTTSNVDYAPAWSPDGKMIAFVSFRNVNIYGPSRCFDDDIYVMDVDGSNQTRLTSSSTAEENPAWSPDGKFIAYDTHSRNCAADGSETNGGLFIMKPDGSENTQIRQGGYSPVWSPDGTQIAFLVSPLRFEGDVQICIAGADGSQQKCLTKSPGIKYELAWSPDGTHIAYTASPANLENDTQIYIMNKDGSEQTQLIKISGLIQSLSWSPDGQHIALSYRNDDWQHSKVRDIFIANINGAFPLQLTDSSQTIPQEDCGFPHWSPDGSHLSVICGLAASKYRSIYIISADGSSRTKLDMTITVDDFGGAAWQP